ncbi:uncharacterized protein LOC116300442 [Actinia tenebrosa]|uniref:Uncharacterized protein LOC116300442 n=1 Tax=Actinia tenebrosa TaxID=6105 RepID=A0A6P8IAK0_ACTTE|nr:uncharacterized protein LOC116300442 [Actinia tenebrosa]
MIPLKTFAEGMFAQEEDDDYAYAGFHMKPKEKEKLFPDRKGCGWTFLRFLIDTLFILSYLVLSIIFISFFVSALAFSLSLSLDMTFEMLSPVGSTQSKKNIISVCLFFLLCSVLVLVSLMLSLFWEVLKAVLLKISIKYNIARVVLLLLVVVTSGVWAGVVAPVDSQVNFADYFHYISVVVWVTAFGLSVLGSLLLIVFVFTHSVKNKKILCVHVCIAVILVMFSVISPIAFGIITDSSVGIIAFVLLLPLFTAFAVIYAYFRGKTRDRRKYIFNKYSCLLYLILFLLTVTILFTSVMNAPTGCGSHCKEELEKNAAAVDRQLFAEDHYQICTQRWTSKMFNIADMAFFANLTYNRQVVKPNSTAIQQLANDFFKTRSMTWTVKHISSTMPYFIHLQTGFVHVIAIRGPQDTLEFVESAKLWDETAVLQSLALVFPILQNLPIKFKAEYVSKSSFINKIFHAGSNSHFFQSIEDYVKQVKNTSDVVLVGHSLGGGIAKIIGARQKIPAVAFSSPGIGNSYIKFGFSLQDAMKFVVTIAPDGDVIPMVDQLYGQVQTIRCTGENFVQCHQISRTYCELQSGCGNLMPGCESVLDN